MNAAAASAAPSPLDARRVNLDVCEMCGAVTERRGAGRPRRFCVGCASVADALARLEAALAVSPRAIVAVVERLEGVDIPRGSLTDVEHRRLRAACFVIGSRGRKLAPGSSGRYTRRPAPSPSVAAPATAPAAPGPLFGTR